MEPAKELVEQMFKELEEARRRPVRVEVRDALSGWKSMADLEARVTALDVQIKDRENEAAQVRRAYLHERAELLRMHKYQGLAGQRADEAELKLMEVRLALDTLVTKIGEVHDHPAYKSVWVLAQIHGAEYKGPSYGPELDAAIAVLERTR